MPEPEKPIHYVDYASQPYVRFACDESNTDRYVWGGQTGDPKVHETGDGDRYTFDETKPTCEACVAKVAAKPKVDSAEVLAATRRLAARGHLPPGSDAAIDAGCKCPVIANARGKGVDGRFQYNLACPVHGDEPA